MDQKVTTEARCYLLNVGHSLVCRYTARSTVLVVI